MFLRLLKHSLGGFRLGADLSVWIDKSKDKRTQLRKIGIGLQETIDLTGYGFIKTGKIDWNNWCFRKPISPDILFNYNAFYRKVNRYYNKVNHFSEIHQTAIQLFQWLAKILANENHKFWTRLRKFDAVSAIWAWTASILTWNFQQQILEVLAKDKTLRPEFIDQTSWSPHSIRFSREGLNEILRTTIIFGSNTGRTAIDRLNHLWQFNDNGTRDGWDKKQYRLLYQALVGYWDQYMLNFGWQWNHHEFIKFFGRFCWVWPNTTNSKWWTKALHSNIRIWQGYASTALWFSSTQVWSLTGPEGEARIGKPDKLDSDLLFGDFESIVGRISASAGLVDCPGHLFIYQFRWKWGDSLWRKEQAPQLVRQLDGRHILESEIYRSPSEDILYQQKINDQDFIKKIFFEAHRTWYKKKGYTHVQEQIGEKITRTKEFIKESKLAMALSKEIPEFEQQWLRS